MFSLLPCIRATSRHRLQPPSPIRSGLAARSMMGNFAEAACSKPFSPSFLQAIVTSLGVRIVSEAKRFMYLWLKSFM